LVINSRIDVRQQLRWLQEYQPVYLLSLPSNLRELLRLCEQEGVDFPDLQQVRCFGETVTAELREHVRRVWGVGLSDIYSSQEVGYMALQCPEHEHYHVQAETMYLEVLDEKGKPCSPGEIGRVVVTPLHNFAMPLLRYEVGDYAEVGEACPCGRGLPVLKRIVGRTRNMARTPEGRCYWPSFPLEDWLDVANIHQFQLRQIAIDRIEVLLAMDGELSSQQAKLLEQRLQHSLNYPFKLDFRYVDAIPAQKNGKYEDFVSLL
jgi:phenylacetate-CoA ligase